VAGATGGDESHGAYMTDAMVNNGALSVFIRSDEGRKVQTELWQELVEILEKNCAGIDEGPMIVILPQTLVNNVIAFKTGSIYSSFLSLEHDIIFLSYSHLEQFKAMF
jgi:hypothetical protein